MFTQLLAGLRGTTQNFEAPGAITILRGSLSMLWVEWAGGEKSNQYPGAVSRGESQPASINLTGGSQTHFSTSLPSPAGVFIGWIQLEAQL